MRKETFLQQFITNNAPKVEQNLMALYQEWLNCCLLLQVNKTISTKQLDDWTQPSIINIFKARQIIKTL